MLFCGACGKQNHEQARFCAYCGQPLQAEAQEPSEKVGEPPPQPEANSKSVWLIGAAIIAVIVIAKLLPDIPEIPSTTPAPPPEKLTQLPVEESNLALEPPRGLYYGTLFVGDRTDEVDDLIGPVKQVLIEGKGLGLEGPREPRVIITYDIRGNPIAFFHPKDGSLQYKFAYTYDSRGSVTRQDVYSHTSVLMAQAFYTYDAGGRLTGKILHSPDGLLSHKWVYGYDSKGNRISKEHSSYDCLGYLVSKELPKTHCPELLLKVVTDYDREAGLASVHFFFPGPYSAEQQHRFDFDIVGNWIKRTVYQNYKYRDPEDAPAGPEKDHWSPEPGQVVYRTITYYEGADDVSTREPRGAPPVGNERILVPGQYKIIRTTPLLQEPRSDSAIVTRLEPEMKINVTEISGDYLRVESKYGRQPGYVSHTDVIPAQSEKGGSPFPSTDLSTAAGMCDAVATAAFLIATMRDKGLTEEAALRIVVGIAITAANFPVSEELREHLRNSVGGAASDIYAHPEWSPAMIRNVYSASCKSQGVNE